MSVPPRFPDPTDRGTGNAEDGAISARPPSRRAEKRERRREGAFGSSGRRWWRPSPCGRWSWRDGRVAEPRHPPSCIGGNADAKRIAVQRDPRSLGETISPRKGPRNRHPIGLGADGKPGANGLPRFSNRGKGRCRHGEGRVMGGTTKGSPLRR